MLLLTKNHDQILQEFIWHTEQLSMAGQAPGTAGNAGLPVTKDTAQQDRQQALEGLRTLGTLIISNGYDEHPFIPFYRSCFLTLKIVNSENFSMMHRSCSGTLQAMLLKRLPPE